MKHEMEELLEDLLEISNVELAVKMLGFESHEEYQRLLGKVPEKNSVEFKEWQLDDGSREGLLALIRNQLDEIWGELLYK